MLDENELTILLEMADNLSAIRQMMEKGEETMKRYEQVALEKQKESEVKLNSIIEQAKQANPKLGEIMEGMLSPLMKGVHHA